jgi:hypothetical protein
MEWIKWQLKWSGDKGEFLRSIAENGSTPQALFDRPKVGLELQPYIDAFLVLSSSRQIGFGGPQPISMESLVTYHQMQPVFEFNEYLQVIQAMDGVFLAHFSSESKKSQAPKPPQGKRK